MKNVLNTIARTTAVIVAAAIFSSAAYAEKINLNKADVDTMQYIPGIGQSKAKRIVNARSQNGSFSSMDQIDAIKGFGVRTMIDVIKHGSLDSGVVELTPEMEENRPSRSLSKVAALQKESAS